MRRILQGMIVALAMLGLAAGTTAFAQKAEPKKTEAAKPAAKAEPKKDEKKADAPAGELMDINSASADQLASLKGIGEVRSKAIVKGRPYKGKDDLVKRKIIPQNVYDDIKEQIIAKQDTYKPAAKKKG